MSLQKLSALNKPTYMIAQYAEMVVQDIIIQLKNIT